MLLPPHIKGSHDYTMYTRFGIRSTELVFVALLQFAKAATRVATVLLNGAVEKPYDEDR